MKIDIEQFLALTVALGCAGAVTLAVYSDGVDISDAVAGIEATQVVEAPESSVSEEIVATLDAPLATPEGPVDLDEAAGIPPVVPDPASSNAPGPTSEMDAWQ